MLGERGNAIVMYVCVSVIKYVTKSAPAIGTNWPLCVDVSLSTQSINQSARHAVDALLVTQLSFLAHLKGQFL